MERGPGGGRYIPERLSVPGAPPEAVLKCVGAGRGEKLMGAIWYGYPSKALSENATAPRRKKGLEGVLTACA